MTYNTGRRVYRRSTQIAETDATAVAAAAAAAAVFDAVRWRSWSRDSSVIPHHVYYAII